jgi:hypothetical protein
MSGRFRRNIRGAGHRFPENTPTTENDRQRHGLSSDFLDTTAADKALTAALDRDLLHCPGRAIALVDDRFPVAVNLVDQAAGLAMAEAGLRPAQQFPFRSTL